jgi:hypothetical protein
MLTRSHPFHAVERGIKKKSKRLDSRPGFARGLSGFACYQATLRLRPDGRRGKYRFVVKESKLRALPDKRLRFKVAASDSSLARNRWE